MMKQSSWGLLGCVGLGLLLVPDAMARKPPGSPKPGCAYGKIPVEFNQQSSSRLLAQPPVLRSENGELTTTLTVGYSQHDIAGCKTNLRTYNKSLVGPTLRVKPGDTLNITLDNQMPIPEAEAADGHSAVHDKHTGRYVFNTTNLHTHGLHVSPVGNSDNVLLEVRPQSRFSFEIKIPKTHESGTYWYHAHLHGSTAIQVSSGMAGALIVEGGLDTVPAIAQATDKTLLFQQIVYDEQGIVESAALFGPDAWVKNGRRTLVNGMLAPTIKARPGEVMRWRMIHGGIRETLQVILDGHQLHEIAVDGIPLGKMDTWDVVELQPGYRSDVLVKIKPDARPGEVFVLRDSPLPYDACRKPGQLQTEAELKKCRENEEKRLQDVKALQSDDVVWGLDSPSRILAYVVIEGAPVPSMDLPKNEELARFRKKDIEPSELTGLPQLVEFNIGNMICQPGQTCQPCRKGDPGCDLQFMVNQQVFSEDNVRRVQLGTAAEWTIRSLIAGHPFHIHVNPFQAKRINSQGQEEWIWRDTLFVSKQDGDVKIRTRYEKYIGKFVLHCHILDHEDAGMMQMVEVVN